VERTRERRKIVIFVLVIVRRVNSFPNPGDNQIGICDLIEDFVPIRGDHECCMHHLTTGVESLGSGAICVDAVGAASRPIHNRRKAINADIIGLRKVACSVEGK